MLLESMGSFRLAVIGDVHSNALALKACLQSIYDYEASHFPIDTIVFMGDLMTYGVRPNETLRNVSEVSSSRDVKLILGNHDQLYIDLFDTAATPYFDKLPDWIKESVRFHLTVLDWDLFVTMPFMPYYDFAGVLFSHANFFFLGSDDFRWRYVNSFEEHCRQIEILGQHDFILGVLGHTHRARLFSLPSASVLDSVISHDLSHQTGACFDIAQYACSVANVGSIGQPRDKLSTNPAWMLVELDHCSPTSVSFVPFEYDLDSHLNDLLRSPLSPFCLNKLISFFQ